MHVKPSRGEAQNLLPMSTRSKNRWCAALFASLFLFAQFALAAQGCMLAFDRASDAHAAMAEEQCSTPMDGTVCVMHCLDQDQGASTPDQHFNAIAPATASRPLDFALVTTRASSRTLCDSRLHVPRTPQVLYCSYQT